MPRRKQDAPIRRGRSRWKPGDPTPKFVTREMAADIVSATLLPVTRRSLEAWPVPLCVIGGRAVVELDAVLRRAEWLIARSVAIRGGGGVQRAPRAGPFDRL
jgi:hypothetical protein